MNEIEELRLPPHSVEAEQAVLGGLLVLNSAHDRVADLVGAADFYRAEHRALWRAIERLIADGKPADVLTVADALRNRGELEDAGGIAYLHLLTNSTAGAANVRRYAEIVREKARRRALIEAAVRFQDEAYSNTGEGVEAIVDRAQSQIVGLTANRTDREPAGMSGVLSRVMESIDARHRGEDHRISTGLIDLDRRLGGGLRRKTLTVLAGRPSSGKSALALQIARHAGKLGHPVMIASLEMSDEENGERLLASAACVDLDRIVTGRLDPEDWDRLGTAQRELHSLPVHFDDSPAVTLNQLRARVRRMRQRHGIELLVVDYLQLMRVDAKGENRNQDVTEIAEGLKALAKELAIAVVALSQMNRDCERRTDKRGMMADLRDSGGLEAAADVIAFVYRDEMYNEESRAKGIAEIILRKARQGKPGTVYTVFRGDFARFENAAPGFVPAFGPEPAPRRLAAARPSFHDVDA